MEVLSVLVVDDERLSRETTRRQLLNAGYRVESVENAFQALQQLERDPWDVVLTDLRMPSMDGLELLAEIQQRQPDADVILMTAYGTVETAVAAMHRGASDFLTKPFSFQELELRLSKLASIRETRRQLKTLQAVLEESHAIYGLVGHSTAMRRVYELIDLFCDNPAPVLLIGETGTGKELVARALHGKSERAKGPFVTINCGAIPRDVAESEIFGHEKGAFTGAIQRRRGAFERAHRGTLLLDDMDDLQLEIQAKLMRVLQEGSLQRVGGEDEIRVNVRVLATTKVDLSKAVEAGRFRRDIYYRLHGLEIRIPALRERGDDVLLLAHHFLRSIAADSGSGAKALSSEAVKRFRQHAWPGNVRELKRVIESAAILCRGTEILPSHLPPALSSAGAQTRCYTLNLEGCSQISFKNQVRQFEEEMIEWALRKAGGEQQRAAEILGLPRTTLQSKLQRQGNSDGA